MQTSSGDQLLRDFASAKEKHHRFDTILVIGHSNHKGLQLADGTFQDWSVVANWLGPFEPKALVLFACLGARFEGVKALFEGISSLRALYGSPIELHLRQVAPLIVAAVARMNGWSAPKEVTTALQWSNFATTGAVLYHWTRRETLKKNSPEGPLWNILADFVRKSARWQGP